MSLTEVHLDLYAIASNHAITDDLQEATSLFTADTRSSGEPSGFQILCEMPGNGFAVRLVHYATDYRQKRHSHNHQDISFLIARAGSAVGVNPGAIRDLISLISFVQER